MDITNDISCTLRAEAHHPPCVMEVAGFCTEHSANSRGMVEESDRGYNMPAYDTATQQYTIQWTWCYREMIPYGT